jgi:glucose-6-phosphate isomerase
VGTHGLDPNMLARGSAAWDRAAKATQQLNRTRGTGWEVWRDLANDPARGAHLSAVDGLAESARRRFKNIVVLGIGGSALGNIALQSALNPATFNLMDHERRGGPRMFVVDNVDPMYLGSVLGEIRATDPTYEKTLFNVVSKSGETAETAAQFMIVRGELAKHGRALKDHVVAITDPAKGTMRSFCDAENIPTLPVPDGVGGRFSVLSPVGLFSAAVCGIDIKALLDGAQEMDTLCSHDEMDANPAAILATLLFELGGRGKVNHVMMPYCNALYLMADWFRQLWAESLGKRFDTDGNEIFAGYTPIKALGTTDQHSQVQLYREGPNDKVFGFVSVDDFGGVDITIPSGMGVESLAYLEGKKMSELLHAEQRATAFAFVESQRPSFEIRFPQLDAHHVGAFIYLWEMVTAYAGSFLGIDTYDQPAVETGKVATFGLMGRDGYSEWKQKVESTLGEIRAGAN